MRDFRQVAIMAKLRPQEADAWPIAEKHNRIFIGWAPWKKSEDSGTDRLSERLLDLSELEDGWDRDRLREDRNEIQVQTHRNLAHEIDAGSMVAVPPARAGSRPSCSDNRPVRAGRRPTVAGRVPRASRRAGPRHRAAIVARGGRLPDVAHR